MNASSRHYRAAKERHRQAVAARDAVLSLSIDVRNDLHHFAQALWCLHQGRFIGARAELNLAGMRK